MADIPFSNLPGHITGVPHELGHGGMIIGNGQAACHAGFAEPLGVHAGHETAAAGRARRIRDVGHRALGAVGGQGIDMRRRNSLVPETAKITIAQIVDEQNDYIGLPANSVLA